MELHAIHLILWSVFFIVGATTGFFLASLWWLWPIKIFVVISAIWLLLQHHEYFLDVRHPFLWFGFGNLYAIGAVYRRGRE